MECAPQALSWTQTLGNSRVHRSHRYPVANRTQRKDCRLNGHQFLRVAVIISYFPNQSSCTEKATVILETIISETLEHPKCHGHFRMCHERPEEALQPLPVSQWDLTHQRNSERPQSPWASAEAEAPVTN